jgi:hypothetical protein
LIEEEFVLLGCTPGDPLPAGGALILTTYRSGSNTASRHTDDLGPYFKTHWGVNLWPGTLNLYAEAGVELPEPRQCGEWMLCPIILDERAVGVVCRKNEAVPKLLEVVGPVQFSKCLGLALCERLWTRLLPGTLLP